jgi:hypothetical protein
MGARIRPRRFAAPVLGKRLGRLARAARPEHDVDVPGIVLSDARAEKRQNEAQPERPKDPQRDPKVETCH